MVGDFWAREDFTVVDGNAFNNNVNSFAQRKSLFAEFTADTFGFSDVKNAADIRALPPLPAQGNANVFPAPGDFFEARADFFATSASAEVGGSLFDDNGTGADVIPNPGVTSVTAIDGHDVDGSTTFQLASGAVVTVSPDGTFLFDPNGAYVGLADGEMATETLVYTLTDDVGGIAPGTFSATINVAGLAASDGVKIAGGTAGDYSGTAVAGLGDVNDDGVDDLIISSYLAGIDDAGSATVYFGSANGVGSAGSVQINGTGAEDLAGISVSGAGDVNGDGIQDILVGAYRVDFDGRMNAGATAVIYGGVDLSPSIDLGFIDPNDGFFIQGAEQNDYSGFSVSGIGDVNNDGLDDVIVGAWPADVGNVFEAGEAYVVFGNDLRTGALDVTNLNGSNGFTIQGAALDDRLGMSVSDAGDVNGDGIDDFIVGAIHTDPGGRADAGTALVYFGRENGDFDATIGASEADFVIEGEAAGDRLGRSVASAGDVNGDGIDDLIVGAFQADGEAGERDVGRAYVVFGSDGLGGSQNVGTLNGSNGFEIVGLAADDWTGLAVANAGDINVDGIDDLVIGAHLAGDDDAGAAYVIFGVEGEGGFSATVDLSNLNGTNGFAILGEGPQAYLGFSVDGAGDVNDDGFDDVLVGSFGADANQGAGYVIYGRGEIAPASSTADIVVTIMGENDAPAAFDDTFTMDEDDTSLAIARNGSQLSDANALDNDIDPDLDDLVVVARDGDAGLVGQNVTDGDGVTSIINDDGSLNVILNGALQFLGEGESQDITFEYTISDGEFTDDAEVTVTVQGENDAPEAVGDAASTDESAAVSDNVLTNDTDIDTNDTRSITAVNGNSALVGTSFTLTSGALLVLNADGSYTYDPNGAFDSLDDGDQATDNFNYTVTDSGGLSDQASVTITIDGEDSGASGDNEAVLDSYDYTLGNVLSEDVKVNDIIITPVDVVGLNGTGEIGNFFVLSSGAFVTLNADGSFTYDATNSVINFLSGGEVAIDSFSYTLDGDGTMGPERDRLVDSGNGAITGPDGEAVQVGYESQIIGDVNGDGIDDILVGAPGAYYYPSGGLYGAAYIIFGTDSGMPTVAVDALDGSNGFAFVGATSYSGFGGAVAGGDVNGDGLEDIIVGTPYASLYGYGSGYGTEVYVLFGSDTGFASKIFANNLDGTDGYELTTSSASTQLGNDIDASGDVNGDGIDDIIIGDPGYYNDGNSQGKGAAYVIFGTTGARGASQTVESLVANSDGFMVYSGVRKSDSEFGASVDIIGDMNGDGFDDILIGDPADGVYNHGEATLIYGGGFLGGLPIDADQLSLVDGIRILNNGSMYDYAGSEVSGIGDFNGDGFDDYAVSIPSASTRNLALNGAVAVIFGSDDLVDFISVENLDGTNGFLFHGGLDEGLLGSRVENVGDLNDDGFDDLAVLEFNGGNGSVHILYGTDAAMPADFDTFALNGVNGTVLSFDPQSPLGVRSFGGGGDLDGDGVADILVADDIAGGNSDGLIYAATGLFNGGLLSTSVNIQVSQPRAAPTPFEDVLMGGDGGDYIDALSGDDIMIGGLGDDELLGGQGNDVIIGDANVDVDALLASLGLGGDPNAAPAEIELPDRIDDLTMDDGGDQTVEFSDGDLINAEALLISAAEFASADAQSRYNDEPDFQSLLIGWDDIEDDLQNLGLG